MALVTVSERVATQPRLLVVTVEPQLTDRLDFTAFVETPWGVLIEVHQRIPLLGVRSPLLGVVSGQELYWPLAA